MAGLGLERRATETPRAPARQLRSLASPSARARSRFASRRPMAPSPSFAQQRWRWLRRAAPRLSRGAGRARAAAGGGSTEGAPRALQACECAARPSAMCRAPCRSRPPRAAGQGRRSVCRRYMCIGTLLTPSPEKDKEGGGGGRAVGFFPRVVSPCGIPPPVCGAGVGASLGHSLSLPCCRLFWTVRRPQGCRRNPPAGASPALTPPRHLSIHPSIHPFKTGLRLRTTHELPLDKMAGWASPSAH
eukprot:scaffold115_cov304-Prasinococcus_capsulatus_cf.AAC.22